MRRFDWVFNPPKSDYILYKEYVGKMKLKEMPVRRGIQIRTCISIEGSDIPHKMKKPY